MILNGSGIENSREWLDKGYRLPLYDRETVKKKTVSEPKSILF